VPEDVYCIDETGLYFRTHPSKTLAQRKVKGPNLQKKRVTLAFALDAIGADKLKLLVIISLSNHEILEGGSLMSMFGSTQIKQLG
jgi:hypothetical protein